MKNDFKKVMDRDLTALSWSPEKSERVLSRARRGVGVGKRLSLSLVLALALLLVAVGALALTLINPFAEKVMEMEHEHGSFSEWTLDEKLTLVAAMEEYGIDTSVLPDVSQLPEAEANIRLGEAIEMLYAGEVGSLHYNILEKAKGFFDAWTLEDKAWYGELLLKYGQITRPNDCLYAMPSEDAMPMEDAYTLACLRLCAAFGIDCDELSGYSVYPFYFSYYAAPDTYYWKFHWRNEHNEMAYSALIPVSANEHGIELWRRPTGEELDAAQSETEKRALEIQALKEKMEAEMGLMITWSFEDQTKIGEGYGVPRSGEITLERAIERAKEALKEECGLSDGDFDSLYAYAYFLVEFGQRRYAISFFEDEKAMRLTPYAVEVDAITGDILALYSHHGNG